MPDAPTIFSEMTSEAWALWTHNPVTAAFFQFLEHQYLNWRETAADLVEVGALRSGAQAEDANLDVVRGKLSTLKELRGIDLGHIQRFYGLAEEEAEAQEPKEPGNDIDPGWS